jgi:hypothetical protein
MMNKTFGLSTAMPFFCDALESRAYACEIRQDMMKEIHSRGGILAVLHLVPGDGKYRFN